MILANGFIFQTILLALSFQPMTAESQYKDVRGLKSRAEDDLSFCYGTNAICSASLDLQASCESFDDGSNQISYYQCLCGNGFVSVDLSCYWCELVYNLNPPDMQDIYRGFCSSASVAIAPIPTKIVALQSSYNSTYTGIISGATKSSNKTAVITTGKSPSPASSTHLNSSAKAGKNITYPTTYPGGIASLYTLSGGGGGAARTTANPRSTSIPPSGSIRPDSSAANSLKTTVCGPFIFCALASGVGIGVLLLT